MSWFRHNLGYKILALFLSVGLWAFVHLQQGERKQAFDDVVEPRNVAAKLLPRLSKDKVRVTVSGPAARLENLTADDVRTYVDLSGMKAGRSQVLVRCEPNRDADVLTCTALPSLLTVDLDARVTRTLPVKVMVTGTPPLGYDYAKPQATPDNAVISGRSKEVALVKQLVASVTVNGREIGRGVNQNARVLPLDGGGSPVPNVEVDPSEVRIDAPLHLEPASKRLIVSPIPTGRAAEGYRVTGMTPRPREVLATGEAATLANLTGVHTRPINVEGLTSNRTVRAVPLEPIVGIDFEPETVNVRIEVRPLQGPPAPIPSPAPAATPAPERTPSSTPTPPSAPSAPEARR
jgi:YbbR domain-containing protein